MQEILKLIDFLVAYKLVLLNVAGLAALYAVVQYWAWLVYGPKDTIGNGISIGQPKAFDNRSLQLRIERLSASLASLKVVSQRVTDNLSTVQKQASSQTNRTVTAEVKSKPKKATEESSANSSEEHQASTTRSSSQTDAAQSETQPTVALAASDVLSEQLNLASQILNLETLYERSLTDRLLDKDTRLQTVLGFQVSITPPRGCENSVAVVEVAVRMLNAHPVSLVAMIPQEKTYNAQTVSASSKSIGGSAVAGILSLGFSRKGESRQLFIHRDADTIAFERDPRSQPTIFENDSRPTVFGWEFRPVLDRSSVSPGIRQMLAVIAAPTLELEEEGAVTLQIQTRSYWRHYNRRTQTSAGKWSWVPWRVDQSRRIDSPIQELKIPNTARIQSALKPRVKRMTWVNSGPGRATVLVEGWNFFSGTKVIIDGVEHREEDGSLILKSHQALEFETSVASLATGDCVLNGRFGSSFLFTAAKDQNIHSLQIRRAVIEPSSFTQELYMQVDIVALNKEGVQVDLTVRDIQKLPEPILFVGTEALRLPYDYFDIEDFTERDDPDAEDDVAEEDKLSTGTGGTSPGSTGEELKQDQMPPANKSITYVRVGTWISKALASSPSVAFRVPFCGFEYQASLPLTYSEPKVTLMGTDDDYCVFRIVSPGGFLKTFNVELDQTYAEGSPELQKASAVDYRFKVPIKIVEKYRNLVLRPGKGEPYVVPISLTEKPKPKTTIVSDGQPPQLKQNTIGPITWTGTALDQVVLTTLIQSGSDKSRVLTRTDFSVYQEGTKIDVYFGGDSTATIGKAEVEFLIKGGEKKTVPIFITKGDDP